MLCFVLRPLLLQWVLHNGFIDIEFGLREKELPLLDSWGNLEVAACENPSPLRDMVLTCSIQRAVGTFQVQESESFAPQLYPTLKKDFVYQGLARAGRPDILRVPRTHQRK